MNTALALALNVLEVLPGVVTAGEDALQLIQSTSATLRVAQSQGRDPSPNEWDAINAQIEKLREVLDAPEAEPTPTEDMGVGAAFKDTLLVGGLGLDPEAEPALVISSEEGALHPTEDQTAEAPLEADAEVSVDPVTS